MTACVALLRGVNVGGNNRVTMPALRELIEELGYGDVRTWINSGNAVFTAPELPNGDIAASIHDAIARAHGLDIDVIVRTGDEMRRIIEDNPFPERVDEPKTLHVVFLGRTPDPGEIGKLAEQDRGDDDYRVIGDTIYLAYPNGLSGAVFQPKLRVPQTSRNWSTVRKLAEMASSAGK